MCIKIVHYKNYFFYIWIHDIGKIFDLPEQRNKKILDEVKKVTYREFTDILMEMDRELVKGALAGEHFQELIFRKLQV